MAKIGKGNALRYFLTAERFPASEAVRVGLVQSAAASEDALDTAVSKLATEIEQNSPAAVRACKALIHKVAGAESDAYAKRDFVTNQIARIRVSPEGQEGLNAFLNKRKPSWLAQ
jgi:methylglutaconyl-CoA hydratase